jgi:hypothetical protein
VVYATYSTQVSSSSTSYADTGLTASITPKFSTSKILVIVSQNGIFKDTGSTASQLQLQLLRNSTVLKLLEFGACYNGLAQYNGIGSSSINYLDSPATTSATTYKTQYANQAGAGGIVLQLNSSTSSITLLEIAG